MASNIHVPVKHSDSCLLSQFVKQCIKSHATRCQSSSQLSSGLSAAHTPGRCTQPNLIQKHLRSHLHESLPDDSNATHAARPWLSAVTTTTVQQLATANPPPARRYTCHTIGQPSKPSTVAPIAARPPAGIVPTNRQLPQRWSSLAHWKRRFWSEGQFSLL